MIFENFLQITNGFPFFLVIGVRSSIIHRSCKHIGQKRPCLIIHDD